jgi:hypothetical protein
LCNGNKAQGTAGKEQRYDNHAYNSTLTAGGTRSIPLISRICIQLLTFFSLGMLLVMGSMERLKSLLKARVGHQSVNKRYKFLMRFRRSPFIMYLSQQESLNRTNAPLIEQLRLKYLIGVDLPDETDILIR